MLLQGALSRPLPPLPLTLFLASLFPATHLLMLCYVTFCVRRLIASDKGGRISDLVELQSQPFFSSLPFGTLREIQAPFVPALESEIDVGYYDDFTNQDDLAKYGSFLSSPSFCFVFAIAVCSSWSLFLPCTKSFPFRRTARSLTLLLALSFLSFRRGLREATKRRRRQRKGGRHDPRRLDRLYLPPKERYCSCWQAQGGWWDR